MTVTPRAAVVLALAAALLIATDTVGARSQSTPELELRAAMEAELKGDVSGAAREFRRLSEHADRTIAAMALLRLAGCYEKLGDARATETYRRVADGFRDQRQIADLARTRLARAAAQEGQPTRADPANRRLVADDGFRVEQVSVNGRMAVGRTPAGDLAVRDLTTDETRVAVPGSDWLWPVLSQDGQWIAYGVTGRGPGTRSVGLRVVGTGAGAQVRPILDLPNGPTLLPQAWSPDAQEILVARGSGRNGSPVAPGAMEAAWVTVADGAIRTIRTFEPWQNPNSLALSHDGAWIAYDDVPAPGDQLEHHIFVMDRDGQRTTPVVTLAGTNVQPVWSHDGRHLLYLAIRSGAGSLWAVPVATGAPTGEPVRLQGGFTRGLKVVSSSGALYYRRQTGNDFLVVVADRSDEGVRVVQAFDGGSPALSPDGKTVAFLRYLDPRDGSLARRFELTIRSLESGAEQAYPHPGLDRLAPIQWCPDGGCLFTAATLVETDGREASWIVRLDLRMGTYLPVIPLTSRGLQRAHSGALSRDGRTMYLAVRRAGQPGVTGIESVDVATGESTGIVELLGEAIPWLDPIPPQLALSPEGERLAILAVASGPPLSQRLVVLRTDGSELRNLHGPVPPQGGRASWTPDGIAIVVPVAEGGVMRAIRVPLDGGPPVPDGLDLGTLQVPGMLPLQPRTGRSLTFGRSGHRLALEVTTAVQVELWAIDHVLELAARAR